jgi:hypothetical protein
MRTLDSQQIAQYHHYQHIHHPIHCFPYAPNAGFGSFQGDVSYEDWLN